MWICVTIMLFSALAGAGEGPQCHLRYREFVPEGSPIGRPPTILEITLGDTKARAKNSIWHNPQHDSLKHRVAIEVERTDSFEEAPLEHVAGDTIPLADAQKMLESIRADGGEAHLDTEASLSYQQNLVVIDKIPNAWKGTHLEVAFTTLQEFGGHFGINPNLHRETDHAAEFIPEGNGTIVMGKTPMDEFVTVHELQHLFDYHDPEHWRQVLRLMRGSKQMSAMETDRKLTEMKASKKVLHHAMALAIDSPTGQIPESAVPAVKINRHNHDIYRIRLGLALLREGKYVEAYRTSLQPHEQALLKSGGSAMAAALVGTAFYFTWDILDSSKDGDEKL